MNALALLTLESSTGTRESFRLLDMPATWIVVLAVLPALALICWLGYRGEALSTRLRFGLGLLRFLALALLAAVLFRPVKVTRREEVQKAEVLVLVDDSASMQRRDAYADDAPMRRALEGLGLDEPAQATRSQIAQALVERVLLPKLSAGDYVPRVFTFAQDVTPMATGAQLSGRGHATHIGDALSETLAAQRGRHVTDVIVISDGRQNGGVELPLAARGAAAAGIPVHTLVVGDARPEKNVFLELVEAPANALEGDEIAISVRVAARGVAGAPRTEVRLEEYEPDGGERAQRRVMSSAEIALSENGERVTLVARAGPADRRTLERRFHVEVPPVEGETLLDDNALEISVHVSPQKVRVLYLEGYPRWEYRRLALDMLKRADENIQFQAFLLSADPDFVQESSRDVAPLEAVPTERKELLENFDVVLLGDVNPYAISPDPKKCDEFMAALVEFVERGGGLCFLGGEYDLPRAYLGTALEAVMPVLFDEAELRGGAGDTTREFHLQLEDPDHPHEVVRLNADLGVNRRLWEDDNGLHAINWFLPVSRAKPGSQVILRHPRESNSYGRYPLLVAGYYPSGRTLFLGFDETWKFRFHYGPRYHERFWRNAIRWLALGRMKSGDRRFHLELARSRYDLGERVGVEARVLDNDFRPSAESTQAVRWSTPEGKTSELVLGAVPGRPGLFRASIEPERTGLFRVWIENNEQRIASAEFEVVLPSLENRDPTPSLEALTELSAISKGLALDPTRTDELFARDFPGSEERRDPISARLDDVWDRWSTLLAALLILSIEWVLRKRYELV